MSSIEEQPIGVPEVRVGFGYDVHAFAEDRQLVLGGVAITAERGLAGHSDADVVAHALCDAFLGASGQGDIGKHFPPSDERFRDADSLQLLRQTVSIMNEAGWQPLQADVTVVAQTPRLACHRADMEYNLAEASGLEVGRVSVKATTTDGLGFVGRMEGIAANAVALVLRTPSHRPS
jgi:2-C-methyl-D-erythritol 2,4-cyclodiphosphate synthase